jgi:hypothetical protein
LVGLVANDAIAEMMTLAMLQKDRVGVCRCMTEPPERHAVISRMSKTPAF